MILIVPKWLIKGDEGIPFSSPFWFLMRLAKEPTEAQPRVGGYNIITASITPGHAARRFLYVRQHVVRKEDPTTPKDRTLFVANPGQISLHALFARCGEIESVSSGCFHHSEGDLQHFAHVVFRKEKGLRRALRMKTVVTSGDRQEDAPERGLKRMLSAFSAQRPAPQDLQADVNAAVSAFEKKEEESREKAEEAHNTMDADGFVVVTRRKKGRQTLTAGGASVQPATESAETLRGRKKEQVVKDFYRFQARDTKREQIAHLRKKFEEDKERIAKMREQRMFRPY